MRRFSARVLLVLLGLATGFLTHEDALPTDTCRRIEDRGAQEDDALCNSNASESDFKAVSLIQRKSRVLGVNKVRSMAHPSHATADEVEEEEQKPEDKESGMEARLAKLEHQIAAFRAEEQQDVAHLEAQLQERPQELRRHAVPHHVGRLRNDTRLSFEQHGELDEVQRETALEESDSDDMDTLDVEMEGHYILHRRLTVFAVVVLLVTIMGIAACNHLDPSDDDEGNVTPRDDVEVRGNLSLPEDTLGFMICVLVRDRVAIYQGTSKPTMRIARILGAWAILGINMFLQVYLCICICKYVVPAYVVEVRSAYAEFELHMYPNHTIPSPINGEPRGIDGYIVSHRRFRSMSDETKKALCQSPFAQLWFFVPLLALWTLRCSREIKNACDLALVLVARMPTVPNLADELFYRKEPTGECIAVINGLTLVTKVLISCFMLIPRILVAAYICWLGSRWLAASPDLGELVLNTVALELMVEIKDLLYATLVSSRNKRDLARTEVRPPTRKERASLWLYMSSMGWFFGAMGWVFFYMFYFQMVLIDFRWDLHRNCARWYIHFPTNIV